MPQVYLGEEYNSLVLGDSPAAGIGIPSRREGTTLATNAALTVSQSLRLAHFTARDSVASTQVRVLSGATAAGATPTLARLALYRIDTLLGILTYTLVASTANDTALFAAANTTYTKSWSSAVAVAAGQRYAFGVLVVTGATAPTLIGRSFLSTDEATVVPRLSGVLAAQADLPATFADSALAVSATAPYAAILP